MTTARPAGEHALAHAWTVYYSHRTPAQRITNYEDAIKNLGEFATVEAFWRVYSHLKRPSEIAPITDFQIFKAGVRPMWEDKENIHGGKWMIRLRKGLSQRFWEDLILGVIGEQFTDPINGIVLSIRGSEDILSVWTAHAGDGAEVLRIRDAIKALLQLPETAVLEYKQHNESLKDNSSFRNTDIFR
ncbi:hypothetical protein H9P43_005625 [Blastocladiella emersonii ATCC 22665]|nr:hypothetical protein H9P43_005625 [Blastocladiella emersonii ATCC 22665]